MEGERTVEMLLDAEFGESEPALSPDGRWLAYVSIETGTLLIYVRPFPNVEDGLWNVSLGLGANPVWSPDGRELFYRSQGGTNLMVAQVETEPTFSAQTPRAAVQSERLCDRRRNRGRTKVRPCPRRRSLHRADA